MLRRATSNFLGSRLRCGTCERHHRFWTPAVGHTHLGPSESSPQHTKSSERSNRKPSRVLSHVSSSSQRPSFRSGAFGMMEIESWEKQEASGTEGFVGFVGTVCLLRNHPTSLLLTSDHTTQGVTVVRFDALPMALLSKLKRSYKAFRSAPAIQAHLELRNSKLGPHRPKPAAHISHQTSK